MKFTRKLLMVCTSFAVLTALPLRADFVSSTTLTASADGATNSHGTGTATVDWNATTDTFIYTLSWANLTGPATMAHIHYGAVGVNGPVVIPFFMPSSPSGYLPATDSISGTLTAADFMPDAAAGVNTIADVATAIENGDAYVNIHTAQYPAGELRGQLSIAGTAAVPEPSTSGLVLLPCAALGVLWTTRRKAVRP